MDIKVAAQDATDHEREVIAATVPQAEQTEVAGRVVRGGWRARQLRNRLLPALAAVQSEVGWVSQGAMNEIARRLAIPPAEVYGVATFYALLSTTPRPPVVAHICTDIGCAPRGKQLCDAATAINPDAVVASPCLGQCDRAPAVFVQRAGTEDIELVDAEEGMLGKLVSEPITSAQSSLSAVPSHRAADREVVDELRAQVPQQDGEGQRLRLLRRVGACDPTDLRAFVEAGGFEALRAAIARAPSEIIEAVKGSGLRGRGGAAFPTGVKWEAVAASGDRRRHLICNADESEPGTFKDRVLIEGDPYALVEAITIAAIAIGCEHAYVYIRGEYPLATSRLQHAIEQARGHGYLGASVLGSAHTVDIEIRKGQGAYICGEETALMESIEGHRGEPRNKPPFPTTNGLFGEPTVINNVETLLNVPHVVLGGAEQFAAMGTTESTGTRLFCVSGSVGRPGVYEFPFGITLGEVLAVAEVEADVRAVLLGGAAGSFVSPDTFDLPLTFEDSRQRGVSLGSGVVMVFNTHANMAAVVQRIAAFFRDESCGQCVPCRVGVVRQEEALARYLDGGGTHELALLHDIDRVMTDASICGLGQTAASAVRSAIRLGLV